VTLTPDPAQHPFRIVVLASGSGTLLQALLDAQVAGVLNAEIVAVGSEIPDAPALKRAEKAAIPTFTVPMEAVLPVCSARRMIWDVALADAVSSYEPDLVVLAGFMKLLGKPFLTRFGGRIINTHPALLPAFPGAHAVRDALAAGVDVTGCSIIWVDDGVDSGEVIVQREVPVLPDDDEPTLHERIKKTERDLLVETVNELALKKS
jgi:phosphoribosylglycinamide formyltransferase-1